MADTAETTMQLPRWDMTPFFPGLDSPEYESAFADLKERISRLEELIAQAADVEDEVPIAALEEVLTTLNETGEKGLLIIAYTQAVLSTDTRNQLALARMSEAQIAFSAFRKVGTRFAAWVGKLDVEALIEQSSVAAEHAYVLRRDKIDAEHQMSPAEEDLAADMSVSGGTAWAKLHSSMTSQLSVPFENKDGETENLPMSEIRNLASDPDRDVRRRAYEAELKVWEEWETPIAAALNGVTGEHLTVATRQGWPEIIDQAVHQNHIDRQTLDAMMSAAREFFPEIRRYFRAKAKVLGVEKLPWYDITAPVSATSRRWEWDDAVSFINEQFGAYSPKLRGLSERAFNENWIDAEPRAGKVGGAFCTTIRGDESRILANYTPAYDGVSTLAHELGHAYHNLCQDGQPILNRLATPMTLAETASTFCETLLRRAAIEQGTDDDKFEILESGLVEAGQIVADISSRFVFEQSVFERRKDRELTADEFSELMLDAQRQTYGDGIDPDLMHPYMWAVKGHYYSPSDAFYNYPYMFGMLFGVGLYAQFEQNPDEFRAKYDDLLARTGGASAAELTAEFGIDIQSPGFWQGSLEVIRKDIDEFVDLVEKRTA